MDEEKGVRRQRRGLRFLRGSSLPREQYESLAVVEPDEPEDDPSSEMKMKDEDEDEDDPSQYESDRVQNENGDDGDEGEKEDKGFLAIAQSKSKKKARTSRSRFSSKTSTALVSSSTTNNNNNNNNNNEKKNTHTPDDDEGEKEDKGFLAIAQSKSKKKAKTSTVPVSSSTTYNNNNNNNNEQEEYSHSYWNSILYKTLLPDEGLSVRGYPLIDGRGRGAATKLLKFVLWTFVSVAIVHVLVAHLFDDRDKVLKIVHIWRYEADLIVRDCVVFFVVGRLWETEKPGIDHLAWMGTAVLANLYFESQNFVWFLQHSVTLFQMHCLWPWELWIFALVLLVSAALLVGAHALRAWNERILGIKLTEMALTIFFFMLPMITSEYFHLHHWYAGWLMGMHFNYNVWWSRLAMAWCWGMYVNGIAVYGRDPVLTCEYSYFLTLDNRCPYIACYLEGLADVNNTNVTEMVPVDWRNCSATDGFHP
eukprot:CAMPEP_0172408240 /NCGR_PEP_ID=MMETSP1061-20121228/75748_1 /TAXON_ID=37318 /ORGANISM="Pseudo-nitzschia pungens, Strain cf. pungens" /LENGTH=477 /DNA_ID=CAMNT_0013144361 /DNA_START=161 /DNA_END=1595 /DNA_ORIENTATION=-